MLVSFNKLKKKTKQSQINPLCSTQLSLFQRNNMVNLCICSMQVHQSRFSLFFTSFHPSIFPHFHPQWLFPHACRFMCLCSCYKQRPPPRSRSSPHCCSWPPFSELGRGTCTYRRLGTGTCTRWPRRAGCCGDGTEIRLVTQDTSWTVDREQME